MARVTSLLGKATGKVGSVVFSVVGGQMVAREYQPNVANPNTSAQVDQRARMKLASQIAAVLSPVIAIPKEGLKSSRNLFIKKNMGAFLAESGIAQVTYENLQLTNGSLGIPALVVKRSETAGVVVELESAADATVTRMVYILYRKTSENTLQYVQSIVVESAGSYGKFTGSLLYTEGDIVVFGYGIKDLNSKASASYSDYNVKNGEDIASLAITRRISTSDYKFTLTRGTTLFAGESESTKVDENQARVFVTSLGNGTVSGAGVYNLGDNVTVKATPAEGNDFKGWRNNGSTEFVSTAAEYSFVLAGQTDLVAVFEAQPEAVYYTVKAVSANENYVTVAPAESTVRAGQSVTVKATMVDTDTQFGGWFLNGTGTAISMAEEFTYTPTDNCTLQARRLEVTPGGDD